MGWRLSWLRLLLRQPDLLFDHLGAHGALLAVDAKQLAQALERRLWLTLLSGLLLGCGIVLAGMAAMLWLLRGAPAEPGLPVVLGLLAVPLLPWLGAAWAWRAARRAATLPAFENVRAQLAADVSACRALDPTGAGR
ncbi:hypothetical protein [Leptothrix discophora]|uniref:ABC transporter ATP-binding protein n=1 Tax=Leptothrix discophora TaxID=89 RepID=A0ABT9G8K0_LEPDI|nr:hypothetical protein [Leptothrix discophora]MDP4302800.1 hypothetical protein [Leptothrix discophora]